jgi:energy-coupling factor transport system permease protein
MQTEQRYVRSFFTHVDTTSWVMRVNPAIKVSYTFVFSFLPLQVFAIFSQHVMYAFYANLILASVSIGLLLVSRVSLGRMRWLFFLIAGMLQFIALWNILFTNKGGQSLFSWQLWFWHNTVTDLDIIWALTADLGYLTMFLATMYLFLTTRDRDIAGVLETIRMPRTFCFVVALTFRSIGIFFDDLATAREALMSRGVDFQKGSIPDKIRRNARLGIPLILIMLRRATDIAFALDVRRFRMPNIKTTRFSRVRFSPLDLIVLAVLWSIFWFTLAIQVLGVDSLRLLY